MSELPRYPDTTGKDLAKRVDELEDYIINLHRFLRFALETIDETNMTTGARGQFLEIKGLYTELYADETGLLSRMTNAEGGVSTLEQNVNGLTSTVQSNTGDISTLTQKVEGFALDVTNGTSSSTIQLKSDEAVISSKTISMSGMVTFTDLSTSGSTAINGANITTGKINASLIQTGKITAVDIEGVNITGCTIQGGSFKSLGTGTEFDLLFASGKIQWVKPNTTTTYATIGYNFNDGLYLNSAGQVSIDSGGAATIKANYIVKIEAGDNLSINAKTGYGIYIGSNTGTTQTIYIGNSNATINLAGTVKVNGTVI